MNFLQCLVCKFIHFVKTLKTVKESLSVTHGTQESVQTVSWLYKPIILSTGNFECSTEVQLNS